MLPRLAQHHPVLYFEEPLHSEESPRFDLTEPAPYVQALMLPPPGQAITTGPAAPR